jgi:hypothetical protein
MRLDDDWFASRRARLLLPVTHHPEGEPRHAHMARGILVGSRLSGQVDEHTERALRHLSPRHRGAVRAHMQFYRSALEVFGFLPSDALVNAAVQIEWLWYTTPFKPFYRDHLAHVMKVAVIALDLLDHPASPFTDTTSTLLDRVSASLAEPRPETAHLRTTARRAGVPESSLADSDFWRAAVLETTRLAGLLHDMAYPDVMSVKVERAAKPVRPRAPFEPGLEDTCRNAVAWMQHHLVAAPFYRSHLPGPEGIQPKDREMAAAVFKDSHSLRAGYAILRILDDARRVGALSPFDVFVLEWAALAVSLHDYDKFFSAKHTDDAMRAWLYADDNWRNICPTFDRDPVSFLVAFADQIQDFGRLSYEPADDHDDHPDRHDVALAHARYPVSAVEVDMPPGRHLALVFELGSGKGTFAPKDGEMVAEIAKDKHKAAAFAPSARPGSKEELPPWLVPGALYDQATVRVLHDGREYGPAGHPLPVAPPP